MKNGREKPTQSSTNGPAEYEYVGAKANMHRPMRIAFKILRVSTLLSSVKFERRGKVNQEHVKSIQ